MFPVHQKYVPKSNLSRVKKILEQFSRTRFLRDLKLPEKRAGFSNPIKNRVLESCSNIFFPLVKRKKDVHQSHVEICML